jgi:hypothetical protein
MSQSHNLFENPNASIFFIFAKFLREETKGEKPIEIRPIKEQSQITIKYLQETFSSLFMGFYNIHRRHIIPL